MDIEWLHINVKNYRSNMEHRFHSSLNAQHILLLLRFDRQKICVSHFKQFWVSFGVCRTTQIRSALWMQNITTWEGICCVPQTVYVLESDMLIHVLHRSTHTINILTGFSSRCSILYINLNYTENAILLWEFFFYMKKQCTTNINYKQKIRRIWCMNSYTN